MTENIRRPRSPLPIRLVLVIAVCAMLSVPVVAALAASPEPSTPAGAQQPTGSAHPDKGPGHGLGWAFGHGFGSFGGFAKDDGDEPGDGAITVTAIAGNQVSLTTADGWTRTITVTPDTTVTKAGATIAVGDLAVGDSIAFRQKKNADGSYSIVSITVRTPKAGGEVTAVTASSVTVAGRDGTKTTIALTSATTYRLGKDAGAKADIAVGSRIVAEGTISGGTFTASRILIQPSVAGGTVTAKTSTTITVKGRDGKSSTIHVDAKTTYKVRGKDAATLADIAVGDVLIASGTLRADGSLDATQVGAGTFKLGKHDKPGKSAAPDASTAP